METMEVTIGTINGTTYELEEIHLKGRSTSLKLKGEFSGYGNDGGVYELRIPSTFEGIIIAIERTWEPNLETDDTYKTEVIYKNLSGKLIEQLKTDKYPYKIYNLGLLKSHVDFEINHNQ